MLNEIKMLYMKFKYRKYIQELDKKLDINIDLDDEVKWTGFAIAYEDQEKVSKRKIKLDKKDVIISSLNTIMEESGYYIDYDTFFLRNRNIFTKLHNILYRQKEYNYIKNQLNASKPGFNIDFKISILKSNKKAYKYYKFEKESYNDLGNITKKIEDKNKFMVYIEDMDDIGDVDKCTVHVDEPTVEILILKDNTVLYCRAFVRYEDEAIKTIKKLGY